MADTKTKTAARPRPLALQGVEGNLVFTRGQVWAWYVIPAQRWSFRADQERINLYEALTARLADLAGRDVHLRVTSQPFPASQWARQLNDMTPAPIDMDAWGDYLVAAQGRVQTATTADKRVYLGVYLTRRSTRRRGAPHEREAQALAREERIVADIVAGPGLEGTRATTADLEWLLHRSVGLCLPPPQQLSSIPGKPWEPTDLFQITDDVEHDPGEPFGPTVRLTRHSQGVTVDAAVYTLGRVDEVWGVDPGLGPWLSLIDQMPFPVEVSGRFTILTGEQARGKVQRSFQGIRDQKKDYAANDVPAPLALDHQEELARKVEDQLTRGLPTEAATFRGWVRFAVPGNDAEQALEHGRFLTEKYRGRQMDLAHPRGAWSGAGQYDLAREFIPGEPVGSTTHVRQAPVKYLAAGVPQVGSTLGDNRGPYVGYTTGATRRAVMFDPWHSTEVLEQSGAFAALGTQGSGKSTLAGAIVTPAVLGGAYAIINDPSGPMAKLCTLPALAPYSRHIDLLRGTPGLLNPFAVVAEPHAQDYADEDDPAQALADAREDAKRTRRLLALDVLTMLLPPAVVRQPRTRGLLMKAVRQTEGRPMTPLSLPVDHLYELGRQGDEEAAELAAMLYDTADMPMARLFFPTGGGNADALAQQDVRLTVLTMPGLVLPPKDVPREDWGAAELLAVPLLHLAAWFTTRLVYGRDRNERKLAIFDEGHQLGEWSAGRALFHRVNRDNRKWNLAPGFFSQNPADLLAMGVENFLTTLFVGRMESEADAGQALRLLGLPQGAGYEQAILGLTARGVDKPGPREFIVRDSRGRVDRMTVDLQHQPELLAALNTTAKSRQAAAAEKAQEAAA